MLRKVRYKRMWIYIVGGILLILAVYLIVQGISLMFSASQMSFNNPIVLCPFCSGICIFAAALFNEK